MKIVLRRTNVFTGVGRLRPFKWVYETVGPDGKRYDNDSLVEIRRVLKKRYPGATIVEPWKEQP